MECYDMSPESQNNGASEDGFARQWQSKNAP
jgi:hypothetical protein